MRAREDAKDTGRSADATLAERFIRAFRLPYVLGCVVVGFVLFGVITNVVSAYAETGDLVQALVVALTPTNVAIGVLVVYAYYVPYYMRRRLAEAEVSLAKLLPDREAGFRRTFGGLASVLPQLATWIGFLVSLLVALNVAAILGTAPPPIVITGGPMEAFELLATIYAFAALGVSTLALSSVVWSYVTISRGIHRFGGAPLHLRPYYEDPYLGLKPVGSLALSLASAYFGFIALFGLVLATLPTAPTLGDVIGVGGFLIGLIVLGLALFFLPLRRLHRQMVEQKASEGIRVREELAPVFQGAESNPTNEIGYLFRLDMMDRKVSAMALWPFDLRILGKLSVVALSVTAILISRFVAILLNI